MSVHIGTAGFSYKDWEGIVYPADLKKRKIHPLEYLAQFLDACEINTSFYGHIRPNVGRDWCRKTSAVNPDFVFSAKLYQGFTHPPRGTKPPSPFNLKVDPKEENLAREGLDSIAGEGKLAAVLMQFPISFKNADDTRDYLFNLISRFREYPLVLEIRHSSWNDPEVLARLAEQGVGFCNIDQPRLGASLRATEHVTSPVGYVRLHGRNYKEWFQADNRNDRYNYLYKPAELKPWTEKIRSVAEKSLKTLAITNNHYKGQAAVNALELKSMLSGAKVKAPETLVNAYTDLKTFIDQSD
ncbi:MAG TPA: DUF72 domain-containing protein [Candidatus Acidoferrales bacterium]|nr:DUF72 domain-containing protein [Candidatus Acidoferrales bacterium]